MNAYKFTGPGGVTHGGFRWPLPSADGPGEWVEVGMGARKTLTEGDLCGPRVLHATDAEHLLDWLNAELYEVEIDEGRGLIVGSDKIGFRRGRLVRRIEAWNERTARLFACDCAEDALQYAAPDARETLECAIYVARCYADGEASMKELVAATAAAWAAARDAAWAAARVAARAAASAAARDAAWDAARDAAWAAAGDAAWAAARDAAWAAARDAAWAAARAKYAGWLRERLGIAS
jgi:hypothetical protein